MILPFELSENERVWLNPQDVASVYEFERDDDKFSEIKMKSGDKHEVWGHAGREINNAMQELEKEPWQR